MKIEVKEVDKAKGVLRITTLDERWYSKKIDKETIYVPSVTWIAGNYPKGVQFYKWLAEKGWDEAEAIKSAAGDKGSKVHKAIEDILNGKEVKIDDKYFNQTKEEDEELTPQEWECLMSVVSWLDETKPKILANEYTTFNDEYGYAGTVDLKCEITNEKGNAEVWIVDFKTSKSIWTEYHLQLSAYKHADKDLPKIGILQVGYTLNKKKWKFTEIEDKFDLFLAAKQIWQEESGKVSPEANGISPLASLENNTIIMKKALTIATLESKKSGVSGSGKTWTLTSVVDIEGGKYRTFLNLVQYIGKPINAEIEEKVNGSFKNYTIVKVYPNIPQKPTSSEPKNATDFGQATKADILRLEKEITDLEERIASLESGEIKQEQPF